MSGLKVQRAVISEPWAVPKGTKMYYGVGLIENRRHTKLHIFEVLRDHTTGKYSFHCISKLAIDKSKFLALEWMSLPHESNQTHAKSKKRGASDETNITENGTASTKSSNVLVVILPFKILVYSSFGVKTSPAIEIDLTNHVTSWYIRDSTIYIGDRKGVFTRVKIHNNDGVLSETVETTDLGRKQEITSLIPMGDNSLVIVSKVVLLLSLQKDPKKVKVAQKFVTEHPILHLFCTAKENHFLALDSTGVIHCFQKDNSKALFTLKNDLIDVTKPIYQVQNAEKTILIQPGVVALFIEETDGTLRAVQTSAQALVNPESGVFVSLNDLHDVSGRIDDLSTVYSNDQEFSFANDENTKEENGVTEVVSDENEEKEDSEIVIKNQVMNLKDHEVKEQLLRLSKNVEENSLMLKWLLVARGGELVGNEDCASELKALRNGLQKKLGVLTELVAVRGKLELLKIQQELRAHQTEESKVESDDDDEQDEHSVLYVQGEEPLQSDDESEGENEEISEGEEDNHDNESDSD